MSSEVRYALSGEVSVAYEVTGSGPIDLVLAPGFISHLEHQWEEPRWARLFNELGTFTRLIRFDKRGTGLSDRVSTPDMDERIDDIRAVMDAAETKQAVLLGISEGGAMSMLYAATYPERVSHLILMGSFSNTRTSGTKIRETESPDQVRKTWGTGNFLPNFSPALAKDKSFAVWWAKYERLSASPSAIVALRKSNAEIDVTSVLPSIQSPTLILHRTGDVRIRVEASREMLEAIPNAKLIELPGEDHQFWLDDTDRVIKEIRDFVGAARAAPSIERVLATVLFTDLVDSTKQAVTMGDTKWRALIDTHFSLARNAFERFRGREVKTLGDGLLATFDGPGRAVRCAQEIERSMKPLGVSVRAGLHTGEVELADDGDVRGIAVNVAARVCQQAGSDEVLVSNTVKDLVAGSGLSFADLGEHALKGLDDPMRLHRVIG